MQSDGPLDEEQQSRQPSERHLAEMQHFLEVLVHDLRTVQRSISLPLELLGGEPKAPLGEDIRQMLRSVEAGVARMNALLAGVSAYSSSLRPARYSFEALSLEIPLQSALVNLRGQIRDSAATVTHGPLPRVWGDSERLTYLFQNLIGNALKHRRDAAPIVDIQAHRDSALWTVSVEDNGIGIAQKYWSRLFVPFYRLHGQEVPGVGLGLAICRKIVEAHGGTIAVDSRPGEGSTFTFTFPADDGI
jgi:light-regulated signal transduction histidine kinase (bacteriophytochrome)